MVLHSSATFTKTMRKVIDLANIPICIDLKYPYYEPIFTPFAAQSEPKLEISISQAEIETAKPRYEIGSSTPYIEYMELCNKISDAMIPYDRVFFHGAAFLWRGKAWIFTAQSGTGKTTQFLLWKELFGDEIQIINGDKPVLRFDNDGITVYPSPWNGKEGMGQLISAPLGGIVLLQQSSSDKIRKITDAEAAGSIFPQFLFNRNTVDDVHAVCRLEEMLLTQTPVWLLKNCGDKASAILCYDTLMEAQL